MIEQFKRSQDYKDICYMIDHIPYITTRLKTLEELGYDIGLSIVKNNTTEKFIEIGKKNDIRMQVTPKDKYTNIAKCIIIKRKK